MPRHPKKLTTVGDREMDLDRFQRLTRHNPDTGCDEWQGPVNNAGYGMFGYRELGGRGRMMSSHRAAFMIANDTTIPPGLQVQHTCHNRLCVTPSHLQLGDHQQKMKAMMIDHRHGFQLHRPSEYDRSNWHLHFDATRIYSVEEIQWCRAATHEEIMERYNVSRERAVCIKSYTRCGYKWLPYDRIGTRLKPGKRKPPTDLDG